MNHSTLYLRHVTGVCIYMYLEVLFMSQVKKNTTMFGQTCSKLCGHYSTGLTMRDKWMLALKYISLRNLFTSAAQDHYNHSMHRTPCKLNSALQSYSLTESKFQVSGWLLGCILISDIAWGQGHCLRSRRLVASFCWQFINVLRATCSVYIYNKTWEISLKIHELVQTNN